MFLFTTVAVLVLLTVHEASSVGTHGINLRCQCISREKKPIGRFISKLEVHPANSHCVDEEIIATLTEDGQRICLDPNAKWVKRVLIRRTQAEALKNKNLRRKDRLSPWKP